MVTFQVFSFFFGSASLSHYPAVAMFTEYLKSDDCSSLAGLKLSEMQFLYTTCLVHSSYILAAGLFPWLVM